MLPVLRRLFGVSNSVEPKIPQDLLEARRLVYGILTEFDADGFIADTKLVAWIASVQRAYTGLPLNGIENGIAAIDKLVFSPHTKDNEMVARLLARADVFQLIKAYIDIPSYGETRFMNPRQWLTRMVQSDSKMVWNIAEMLIDQKYDAGLMRSRIFSAIMQDCMGGGVAFTMRQPR